MPESPYPMFDFGSDELAEHNREIRDPDGRYRIDATQPYWIRYQTLNPGKLPTFRVLLVPQYRMQHGHQLREEIWHEGNGVWVDAKAGAA